MPARRPRSGRHSSSIQAACRRRREALLKLAMKGFHEKTEMYKVGSKRTSKRVYELRFDSGTFPATLEAQAAPAAAPAAPRNLSDQATARRSEAERVGSLCDSLGSRLRNRCAAAQSHTLHTAAYSLHTDLKSAVLSLWTLSVHFSDCIHEYGMQFGNLLVLAACTKLRTA